MHHLKNLGCGYKDRICVGIPQFPKANEIFCARNPDFIGIFSDSGAYFNNFYNIPTAFQGIIRNTPYLDLGTFQYKNTNCVQSYDPLTETGLFDAFNQLALKQVFIQQYGDYNKSLQCYTSDAIQKPGVLTPSAQLNDFAIVPLQAIPTTALSVVTEDMLSISVFSLDSGCAGFKITVKKLTGYRLRIKVRSGKIYTQTDANGKPVAIQLDDAQFDINGKQNIKNSRVYLNLEYKIYTDTWVGKLQAQSGEEQTQVQLGHKRILLGTVSYAGKGTKVQQTNCSPVDARLGTDITKASKSSSQETQVLTWKSSSYIKKWMLVRDCG